MKLAIFGRATDSTDYKVLHRYFEYLLYAEIAFKVYRPYWEEINRRDNQLFKRFPVELFDELSQISDARFMLSFGGDGTVLECVRLMGNSPYKIPILGVNFGRLGYLTSITQNELNAATEALMKDAYRIEERGLLAVVSEPTGIFGEKNFGLNDLTIHKSNTNEMITIHVYVNGEFLNAYKGDGLVIATPTGSTAYSLACGGPIIFPSSQNFIITPVAPHSLTVRPVVLPDNCVISCKVESRSGQAMAALDTRTEHIKNGTSIAVQRADFKATIVRMPENNHISTLRRTLHWGWDSRK